MIDRGEALLAVTGVRSFLERPVGKVTLGQQQEAARMADKLRLLASKLVLGTLEADAMPDEPIAYDALLDAFAEPPDDDQLAMAISNMPPADHDDAGAYLAAAGRAWAYLQSRYPIAPERGLLGATPLRPSDIALTKFEFELLIVDKPLGVFGLIDSGALLAPQVRCLTTVYPSLHGAIVQAIAERITAQQARGPGYEPPFTLALSTLTGSPHVDPVVTRGLAAAAQSRAAAAQQARSQQPQQNRAAEMSRPPSERSDL
ncbi:MAG TPA: hypothetical protein VI384_04475 [Candidatus Dormibacteraeota bacterium]